MDLEADSLLCCLALSACGPAETEFIDPTPPPDLVRAVPADLSATAPDLTRPPDLAAQCPNQCAAPTPLCDPGSHRCVECLALGDCPLDRICAGNACVPGCAPGHAVCGDAGSCDVDLGVCRGCRADAECTDKKSPVCDVLTGLCQPCTLGHDVCPPGTYCTATGPGFTCAAGCRIDFDCFAGTDAGMHTACCNNRCIDTWSAATDCGACGKACNPGGSCCSGACVDQANDLKNCGACGNVCPSMNNIAACQVGKCGTLGCVKGFGDCDKNPGNGCEVALDADVKNCGACGATCSAPNANSGCIGGICLLASCVNGFINCNGALQDGCEVDGANDIRNCGACGNACGNVAHATPGCAGSKCVALKCDAGFGDCNKDGSDGCESVLATDPLNCNGCGMVCPLPPNHVGAACAGGVCGAAGCQGKWADCDKSPVNGCEVDTTTDASNCGACGKICDVNTPVCKDSQCIQNTPVSCKAALKADPKAVSGQFKLDADGAGPNPAFNAYCQMDADGGGWTLVAKVNGADAETVHYAVWGSNNTLGNTADFDITKGGDVFYDSYATITGDEVLFYDGSAKCGVDNRLVQLPAILKGRTLKKFLTDVAAVSTPFNSCNAQMCVPGSDNFPIATFKNVGCQHPFNPMPGPILAGNLIGINYYQTLPNMYAQRFGVTMLDWDAGIGSLNNSDGSSNCGDLDITGDAVNGWAGHVVTIFVR